MRTAPIATAPRGDASEHAGTDEPQAALTTYRSARVGLFRDTTLEPVCWLEWRLELGASPGGTIFPLRSQWEVTGIHPNWRTALKFEAQYEARSWLQGEGSAAVNLHRSAITFAVHTKEVQISHSVGATFNIEHFSASYTGGRTTTDRMTGIVRLELAATTTRTVASGDQPAQSQIDTQWQSPGFRRIETGTFFVPRIDVEGRPGDAIALASGAPELQ